MKIIDAQRQSSHKNMGRFLELHCAKMALPYESDEELTDVKMTLALHASAKHRHT